MMCGRKTLTKGKLEIIERLSISFWDDSIPYQPSYNVAPTHFHPVLLFDEGRKVKLMRWGLIPTWVKDTTSIPIMINARVETVTTKPSFANLVGRQRCLVITDGYYEWKKDGNRKQPYYIHHHKGDLLLMAGLWSRWVPPTGYKIDQNQAALETYTIITTVATEDLNFIHPRMPALISQDVADIWLDCYQNSPSQALSLIQSANEPLEAYPVSNLVNSVNNNSPACIQRLGELPPQTSLNL